MPVSDLEFPMLSKSGQAEFATLLSRYRVVLFERLVGRLTANMGTSGDRECDAAAARYLGQLLDEASSPKALVRAHIDNWATMQLLQQAANPDVPGVDRARLFDELARTVREGGTDPALFLVGLPAIEGNSDQPGMRIAFDSVHFGVRGVGGNTEQKQAFTGQLTRAFALIAQTAPEIANWIQVIVPLVCWLGPCGSDGTSRSESYSPGGPIFLSSATNDWDLAENLVHETQHHRFHLWVLARPFASITSSQAEFVSPWRQDIRPLYGLHLGLHAFLMVNILRMRFGLGANPSIVDRFAQTHASNLFAFSTIVDFDSPTQLGINYLRDCARVLSEHDMALDRQDSTGKVEAVLDRIGTQCERGEREFAGLRNTNPGLRNRQTAIALTKSLKDIHDEVARFPLSR